MNSTDETRVRMIPVAQIRVVNPRVRDKKKFAEIVESIANVGLKKPITVTEAGQDQTGQPTFDLVCGQGRLEAYVALEQKEIPAFVRALTTTEGMLASLIENIARRKMSSLDQFKTVQWMKDQGHTAADIAVKTGLTEGYIKLILGLLRNGEERLLDAVLQRRIPIAIAVKISGMSDEDSQRIMMEAYEKKEMTQKTLTAFKRVVEQRKFFGRGGSLRTKNGAKKASVDSMVLAYKRESQRQRLMVKKAKICEVRLLAMSAAFSLLMGDEDFVNLLRAEGLNTMPKFLSERAKKSA
jgi:ParB family chromosome partitioning protein